MCSSDLDQAEKGYDNQTTDGFSTAGDEQAIKAGLHNVSAMEREMGYKGVKSDADTTVSYVRTDYDQALIQDGTIKANQVEEVDPLANFVVGAVSGAGIDYAIQVAQNKLEGKDWSDALTEIDKESLAISAGTGAAGVGLVSKLQKLNKLQKAGKLAKTGTAAGAEAAVDGADSIAKIGRAHV